MQRDNIITITPTTKTAVIIENKTKKDEEKTLNET